MWRKEDGRPHNPNEISTAPLNSVAPATPVPSFSSPKDSPASAPISPKAVACVSQGIKIKGEITGSEDLFIDGIVEGKVSFQSSVLTVGPNATVKADINAREIVVRGHVDGRLDGSDRVQIWSSARINGDIRANRVAIEEGAEVHGKMEAGKSPSRQTDTPGAKKPEVSKPKEADVSLEKPAPGAAVAGAD